MTVAYAVRQGLSGLGRLVSKVITKPRCRLCHFQVLYVEDGTCDTHFLPSEILTDILAKSPTEMFEMNGSKARTWLIPRECVGYYGSPIQVSDPTTFRT